MRRSRCMAFTAHVIFLALCCLSTAQLTPVFANDNTRSSSLVPLPDISLDGETLIVRVNGQEFHMGKDDGIIVQQSEGFAGYYVAFGEKAAEATKLAPSLLLFSPESTLLHSIPFEDADICDEVSLSPDGKVLAIDVGTGAERLWVFRSLPFHAELGEVSYLTAENGHTLFWTGRHYALVNSYEDRLVQDCPEEACGFTSVLLYDPLGPSTHFLLQGDKDCSYTLHSLDGSRLTAEKRCRTAKGTQEAIRQTVELGDKAQRTDPAPTAPEGSPSIITDSPEGFGQHLDTALTLLLRSELLCGTHVSDLEIEAVLQGVVWRFGHAYLPAYTDRISQVLTDLTAELESLLLDESATEEAQQQCPELMERRHEAIRYFIR